MMNNSIERQKILQIVEAFGGGVFTYFVDLSNILCEEFDVYIAYGKRPQTPANFRDYFDKRIKLIEVTNFTRSLNPVKDGRAFIEIKKIARKVKPDIIHLHSSKAGALGRWAFNGRKTPMFYTPHGYSFLMQNCGWMSRTIYKMIEVISSKRNCITISCSSGEHDETIKFQKKAVCISNGIDIERLQQLVEGCDKSIEKRNTLTVFTSGRICHQKNPELFNEVAKLVPDIKFLWVGDGELRDKLTSPNIQITGWVSRGKALEYSINADVFILTSLWEGFPISLLESMYMKKMCIVTDVIGNRDVIHHEENGYICRTAESFASIIKTVKNGVDGRILENAYADVINKYNTHIMKEKYSLIYQSGMKNKTNTARSDRRSMEAGI